MPYQPKNVLFRFLEIMVYSNVFISGASVAFFCVSTSILGVFLPNFYLFLVFLATFLTYNLSIFYVKVPVSPKFAFILQNHLILKKFFALGLGLILFILPLLKFEKIIFLLHLAIISVFYSVPFYKSKALRNLPYSKFILVAYVWAAVAVLFPTENYNFETWRLFWGQFCFIAAITLPFDIRDYETDKKIALKTLPLKIGLYKTKIIAILFLIISDIMFFEIGENRLILNNFLGKIIILGVNQYKHELYFTGLIDALIMTQFLFYFVKI